MQQREVDTVSKMRLAATVSLAAVLFGVASVGLAQDRTLYMQHPERYCQKFANRAAWTGRIVEIGPQGLVVVRYNARIRVTLLEGEPWLYAGQRVRIYPLGREGRNEIAQLRLPDLDFQPVGLVKYRGDRVPRERLRGYDGCRCMPVRVTPYD